MKNIPKIQLSEFDAITETHTFSKRYQKQKKHLLHTERHHAFSFRTALIAAMITVLTVGGVYAAVSHTEFYKNLWGDTTERQDTPSKEISYVVDKGYISEGTITLPAKQYQNVTPEEAADILNGYAMELPKSITVRDHTFTAISAIRDGNCVITEFTLECPTGVNALTYSEISDYVHGAIRSDEATFEFNLGYDKIYVDEEHSTDTLWHCYMYTLMTTEAADTSSDITFVTYDADPDMPIQEVYLSDPAASEKLTRQKLSLEIPQNLPSQIYAAASGEYLDISPIGARINLQKFVDPSNSQMTISYKDGTEYVVMDDSENLDNTAAFVGIDTYWHIAFNSLVDIEKIDSIEVNGMTYQLQTDFVIPEESSSETMDTSRLPHIALGETGYYSTYDQTLSYTVEDFKVYDTIADAGITIDETAYGWEIESCYSTNDSEYAQILQSEYDQYISKLPFVLATIRVKYEDVHVDPELHKFAVSIGNLVSYSPLISEEQKYPDFYIDNIYISDPVDNGLYHDIPLYEKGDEIVIQYGFVCTENILESEQIWLIAGGNDDIYSDDVYFDLFE